MKNVINWKTKQQQDSSRKIFPETLMYKEGQVFQTENKKKDCYAVWKQWKQGQDMHEELTMMGKNENHTVVLSSQWEKKRGQEESTARRIPQTMDQLTKLFDEFCDYKKKEMMETWAEREAALVF